MGAGGGGLSNGGDIEIYATLHIILRLCGIYYCVALHLLWLVTNFTLQYYKYNSK